MSTLGFIGAKGTSTRLPGKNLMEIGGRSLLARAIDIGLQVADEVVVATDHGAIASAAHKAGARLHWIQPERLHQEVEGGVKLVLDDLLAMVCGQGCTHGPMAGHDLVTVLWPTSPLRTVQHQTEAKALLDRADVVMSVVPYRQSPKWAMRDIAYRPAFVEDAGPVRTGLLVELSDLNRHPDTQGPLWKHDGTALWCRTRILPKLAPSFYGVPIAMYPMKPEEAVDVDTALDAAFVEFLLARKGRA